MPAEQVAKTYKSLWCVDRTFREQKSTLELPSLLHLRGDTRIGHIVVSFFALGGGVISLDEARELTGRIVDEFKNAAG